MFKKIKKENKKLLHMNSDLDQQNSELRNKITDLEIKNRLLQEKLKEFSESKDNFIQKNNELYRDLNTSHEETLSWKERYEDLVKKYDNDIKEYFDLVDKLEKENELKDKNKDVLIETNKTNSLTIKDLTECLEAIAKGVYKENTNIELFVLKTYRGWSYLCHDGEKITDFSKVSDVDISWSKDRSVSVEIHRE